MSKNLSSFQVYVAIAIFFTECNAILNFTDDYFLSGELPGAAEVILINFICLWLLASHMTINFDDGILL